MKKVTWFLTIVVLLGFALSACGGGNTVATEPVVEETTTPVEATEAPVVEEPTFDVAELDMDFDVFLDDMESYNTITPEALNLALAENPPFLLDVRSVEEVEGSGHIEGSVLIPLRDLADNLSYLPSFETPIVSYCGSGWRCTIALTVLEAMGWQDVKGLKGGSYAGWVEAGYPVVEGVEPAAEMLNAVEVDPAMVAYFDDILTDYVPEGWGVITAEDLNLLIAEDPNLILVDVRTEGELESNGVIDAPNVINIPLNSFIDMKAEWPAQDANIVVYCGTGHRSTIAATILWSYGYTNVLSLKDGFGAWKAGGFPTVGGLPDLDTAFNNFLAGMEGYNAINLDVLNTALVENPPFLLDVRTVEEAEANGHIEGSVLIPLSDLADNLAYLPSFDTPIVSYCGSGWRCTIALTVLEAMGWQDVKGLKGGSFGGWKEGGYAFVEGAEPAAEMLNAAVVDAGTVAYFDDVLTNYVPEGWGAVKVEDLNLLIAEDPDLILIDVRTLDEVTADGVIDAPNVINIPLADFINLKSLWPAQDAKIVVYCGTGHRSTIAATILWSYQYTNVGSLKDGFGAWTAAGYATTEYVAP